MGKTALLIAAPFDVRNARLHSRGGFRIAEFLLADPRAVEELQRFCDSAGWKTIEVWNEDPLPHAQAGVCDGR